MTGCDNISETITLNADCVSKSAAEFYGKLTSDALTFLVELISAACCKFVLSKIRGYRSMLIDILQLTST
jgi:hypothetical protein